MLSNERMLFYELEMVFLQDTIEVVELFVFSSTGLFATKLSRMHRSGAAAIAAKHAWSFVTSSELFR